MLKNKNQKGFTLIELLIVIAVLGILAAVLIPNVSSFIKSGNLAGANAEVSSVNTAIQAYFSDNNRYPTVDNITKTITTELGTYLGNSVKGTYTVDNTTGKLVGAWTNLTWDNTNQKFIK